MQPLKRSISSISSYFSRGLHNWWRRFRIDPYWRASIHVFSAIIFTFLPIVLLSVPVFEGGDNITKEILYRNFMSYWRSGEIALPILAVCGTLFAIVILNRRMISGVLAAISLLFSAISAIGVGYILGTNRGFERILLPEIVAFCFLVYVFALFIWFLLSVSVDKGPGSGPSSEARADALLAAARMRQTDGGPQ